MSLISPTIEAVTEMDLIEAEEDLRSRGFNHIEKHRFSLYTLVFGVWQPPNKIGGPVLVDDQMVDRVPQEWLDWAAAD